MVYDNEKYFYTILKFALKKTFKFQLYSDCKKFENALPGKSIALFAIYTKNDLANFKKVSQKETSMIVCTSNTKIFEKVKRNSKVLFFDNSKIKSQLITEIKDYLKPANLSIKE